MFLLDVLYFNYSVSSVVSKSHQYALGFGMKTTLLVLVLSVSVISSYLVPNEFAMRRRNAVYDYPENYNTAILFKRKEFTPNTHQVKYYPIYGKRHANGPLMTMFPRGYSYNDEDYDLFPISHLSQHFMTAPIFDY